MADDLKEVLVRIAELTAGPEPNFVNTAGAAVLRNGGPVPPESGNFPNLEIKEEEVAIYKPQVVNIDTLADEIDNAYARSCDPTLVRPNPIIEECLKKKKMTENGLIHCDFPPEPKKICPQNVPDALYSVIEKWSRIRYSAHFGMISTNANRCKKCEELECKKK